MTTRLRRLADEVIEVKGDGPTKVKVLVGTPTLGKIRMEWHNAWGGLVVPTNWHNSQMTPFGYLTHDAQNLIVTAALERGVEYLVLVEDDNLVPPDLFLKLRGYIEQNKRRAEGIPVVSALYHVKGTHYTTCPCRPGCRSEPMIYRGRGTGPYISLPNGKPAWKPGDLVWADGVPTGCVMIHMSLIEAQAKTADRYTLPRLGGAEITAYKIFDAPRAVIDAGLEGYQRIMGTSDLAWCEAIMAEGILAKTGWTGVAKRRYPFAVDTALRSGHIDFETGAVW